MGRHIPAKIRRVVQAKFAFRQGVRCGFPGCKKPAMDFHHTKRFALVKRHLAEEIVPLCKIHHELAHAGLIENEEGDPLNWEIGEGRKVSRATIEIDRLVNKKGRQATMRGDEIVEKKDHRQRWI